MLNHIASEINPVRNKITKKKINHYAWNQSVSWPLNVRPAAKTRFAPQHNLPAKKKIIETSVISFHHKVKVVLAYRPLFISCKFRYVERSPWEFNIQNRAGIHHIHGRNNCIRGQFLSETKKTQKTQEMTSKCDTTAKIRLICSVKVWNPPQLNLLSLDVRNNIKNFQSLATRTAPN